MPPKPLFILTLLLLPALASAAFVPLVGIPGIDANASFNDYINALYALSISIAALIAVIKIIIAGVKWMLSDVVSSKQEAKSDIEGALLGLLLIIAAVLILEVINPQLKSSSLFLGKVDTVKRAPAEGGGEGRELKNRAFDKTACPDNNNNTSGCQIERAKCATDGGRVTSGQYGTTCSFDAAVDSGVSPMNPGGGGGGGGNWYGTGSAKNPKFPDGTSVDGYGIDNITKMFPDRAPNLQDDKEWCFVWRQLNNVPPDKSDDCKSYALSVMDNKEKQGCLTCFKRPENYIDQINAARKTGTGGSVDLGGNGGGSSPVVNNDYGNPAISAVSSVPVTQGGVTMTTMAASKIENAFATLQSSVKPGTMRTWARYGTSENDLNQGSSISISYADATSAAKVHDSPTSYSVPLTPNTVYYYKICATNDAGTLTPVCGNIMKFKTLP